MANEYRATSTAIEVAAQSINLVLVTAAVVEVVYEFVNSVVVTAAAIEVVGAPPVTITSRPAKRMVIST